MHIICFIACTSCLFIFSDAKLTIPLYRQKTPREYILNAEDIPDHGVWLDWLKKPKPNPYRNNDTIPLLKFLDLEFYANIFVGSPGKPTKVIFDTAWSTSWLISKDCPTKRIGCWFHNKYNHKQSSSYRENGEKYVANEGSYNMSGYYSTDLLKFGHSTVNQTFVEMTDIPYWYLFSRADGVIGLGLPTSEYAPFFSNILSQTNITKPVFSIYLNRDRSSKKGGSIILGEIDKKHIHVTNKIPDNITYVPVNANSGLWEFNMERVSLHVGNKSIPLCTSNCVALADTSTNSIITSPKFLDEINKQIGATPLFLGRYKVDCSTANRLPFINFTIGGTNFTLTGKDYTQQLSEGPFSLCMSAFTAATTVSEENRWILGGAFLAKFYTIYDLGQKMMGFVRAA